MQVKLGRGGRRGGGATPPSPAGRERGGGGGGGKGRVAHPAAPTLPSSTPAADQAGRDEPAAATNNPVDARPTLAPTPETRAATSGEVAHPPRSSPDCLPSHAEGVSLDRLLLFIVTAVSAFTRFYRLDQPAGVVFDEHHFGRFTNQYHAGTYFFDIHPPLGKLVLYGVGKLVGYNHTVCGYAEIDDEYDPRCKYYWLRATSATFGTFTAPLLYHIARVWGGSPWAGALAAGYFILDGLNVGEARLILIDAQLLFWCAAALAMALAWWRRWNEHADVVERMEAAVTKLYVRKGGAPLAQEVAAVRHAWMQSQGGYMTPLTRIAWAVACGVVFANAISIKFTGLATPGIVAVESFFAVFFLRHAIPLPDLLLVAATSFFTFATYYAIHFALLPLTGDGDDFMPEAFKRTLVGNPLYDPAAPHPGFWSMFAYLNVDMVRANAGIEGRHPWESVWWEWPLNLRGILYYTSGKAHTYTGSMYLLGNPMVIWPVAGIMAVGVVVAAVYLRLRSLAATAVTTRAFTPLFRALAFCAATYALNLLPYLAVKRSCFIYHYMPALMYGQLACGMLMDALIPGRWRRRVITTLLAVAVAGYAYYAPWVYAMPINSEAHARRRWLPRWD